MSHARSYLLTSLLATFGVSATAYTGGVLASAFPERPITMVVGYAAGGATDILARTVAKFMADDLGQPVIIENKAGANSNIGADYVARAKNDGYTIYVNTIANTINSALYNDLSYDITTDFEFIGLMASIANVLVVNPDRPYQTVDEYIQYAKDNPGRTSCASSGTGSSIHMSCELFMLKTGTDILHVPYRGSSLAVQDLVAGQVDSMFDNYPSSASHINSGMLRALATTTHERIVEDIATFKEEGVEDFIVASWFGLAAPAGTPEAVINKLNHSLNTVLAHPELQAIYQAQRFNLPPANNTPENLRRHNQAEVDQWALVVKEANIAVE